MPTADFDKLQEIMDDLPDAGDFPEHERRQWSLTKADVLVIYRIARIAQTTYVCPFDKSESESLVSIAKNVNRTQKIAAGVIITGAVVTVLSGIWYSIKFAAIEFIKHGSLVK